MWMSFWTTWGRIKLDTEELEMSTGAVSEERVEGYEEVCTSVNPPDVVCLYDDDAELPVQRRPNGSAGTVFICCIR